MRGEKIVACQRKAMLKSTVNYLQRRSDKEEARRQVTYGTPSTPADKLTQEQSPEHGGVKPALLRGRTPWRRQRSHSGTERPERRNCGERGASPWR